MSRGIAPHACADTDALAKLQVDFLRRQGRLGVMDNGGSVLRGAAVLLDEVHVAAEGGIEVLWGGAEGRRADKWLLQEGLGNPGGGACEQRDACVKPLVGWGDKQKEVRVLLHGGAFGRGGGPREGGRGGARGSAG